MLMANSNYKSANRYSWRERKKFRRKEMTYGKLAMQSRNAGKLYDQCKEFRNAGTPDCRKTHCKGPVIEDQTEISSLDAVA